MRGDWDIFWDTGGREGVWVGESAGDEMRRAAADSVGVCIENLEAEGGRPGVLNGEDVDGGTVVADETDLGVCTGGRSLAAATADAAAEICAVSQCHPPFPSWDNILCRVAAAPRRSSSLAAHRQSP